jgi:hypothetical protein
LEEQVHHQSIYHSLWVTDTLYKEKQYVPEKNASDANDARCRDIMEQKV